MIGMRVKLDTGTAYSVPVGEMAIHRTYQTGELVIAGTHASIGHCNFRRFKR